MNITSMIRFLRSYGDNNHPFKWASPCTIGSLAVEEIVFKDLYAPFRWLINGVGGATNNYMKDYRKQQKVWMERAREILKIRNIK